MRILITGNMGYVGPAVVRQLRESYRDGDLMGLDAGYYAHCLTGASTLPEHRLDCQLFADVRNVPVTVLSGVDAVVHLAAVSNDPIGAVFEDVTLAINHRATIELARSAKLAGVGSFVFASSCSVYGLAEDGERTEASAVNPLTAYARSKILAENELRQLADRSFTVTSLRFGTACGMSERLRLDLVLNDFVAGAIASRKVALLSDGSPWRPLIHVRDMARAIDWAVTRGQSDTDSFLAVNVGSDEWNYQVRELAESVARTIPGVKLEIPRGAEPDSRSYRVGFGLFKKLAPRYQPQVDLESTIRELWKNLEMMAFSDANFRSSRFIRLEVLNELRQKGLLTDQLEWVAGSNGRFSAL